jgi:hypothetical protein
MIGNLSIEASILNFNIGKRDTIANAQLNHIEQNLWMHNGPYWIYESLMDHWIYEWNEIGFHWGTIWIY